MTVGEKIAYYRKRSGYTQELLGEKLGVTRQAVSKWESNSTFPETDKLILLSKLFNCHIDDLLNNEILENQKLNPNVGESSMNKILFTPIWSMTIFLITLLLFMCPFVGEDNQTIYTSFDRLFYTVYDVLFQPKYDCGNTFVLLAFISQLIMVVIGIVLLFKKKEFLYKIRLFFSIFECVIWLVMLALEYLSLQAGMLLMIFSSVINFLGLFFIDSNKFPYEKQHQFIYNNIITLVINIVIFILYVVFFTFRCLEHIEYNFFSVFELIIFSDVTFIPMNVCAIIGVLLTLIILVISILFYLIKKKIYYYLHTVFSIYNVIVWIIFFVMTIVLGKNQVLFAERGILFIIALALVNLIWILLLKVNKKYN